MPGLRRLFAAVGVATAVAACSGGGDDGGTGPTPTIDITLSSATLSVQQGANGTVNLTLSRGGGFAGAVNVTIDGAPTGVTATAAPASIGAGSTSSVITVAAGATAAPGNYNLTVRATGSGVSEKTATIALTVTAAPTPTYTLTIAPTTLSVAQGANGTATVTIARTNGFAGDVALTADGLPTGVTAAFNPATLSGATTTSTLTLTAAANATTGTATVTVHGASGQTDKTATLQLTVTATASGNFTLTLAPTTLSVQQGTSGNTTVTINRTNGFAGTVNLTATGLPNGVTAAFNPAAATANTSTLTLTATGTAALGQATVTVRGNATGLAEQTATLTLTVTAASGGTGNTTWEFCSVDQMPLWLAVQDGNGAWTQVTPTGTKFQFNITQAKGGVAFVTGTSSGAFAARARTFSMRAAVRMQQELLLRNRRLNVRTNAFASTSRVDGFELQIYYGTQTELNTSGTTQCLPGAGKTVNGTVAGLSATQNADISLGTASASATAADPTFQLVDVPDGSLDLMAARSTTNTTTFETTVDKLILRRNVNAAANSTLPVLDFGSAEAFAPAVANLTVGNLGSDLGFATTAFFTANGAGTEGLSIFSSFTAPGPGPFTYYGVPTSKQVAGDLHLAVALAFPNDLSADNYRIGALFFKDPTDRTVTLGASLTAPTVTTVATTPYVRLKATGTLQADYNKFVTVNYDQSAAVRSVTISASEGYLTGSNSYDLTIPDFSGVAGWNNDWGLKPGNETDWSIFAYGYTGVGFGSTQPVEGATFKGAGRIGTLTP